MTPTTAELRMMTDTNVALMGLQHAIESGSALAGMSAAADLLKVMRSRPKLGPEDVDGVKPATLQVVMIAAAERLIEYMAGKVSADITKPEHDETNLQTPGNPTYSG
jgi:hypothetical protein